MRFSIAALLGLAASVTADELDILRTWEPMPGWTGAWGIWHSGYGHYVIDAREGCRDPPDVPAMDSICFDWTNMRAHFYFSGQPKRCLAHWHHYDAGNCGSVAGATCNIYKWKEVPCTW